VRKNVYNWVFQKILYFPSQNRVIHKVNKKQHQNPKFDHTQGEIFFKKLVKKDINIQRKMKLRKPSILVVNRVSSCLSFFLSASTAATYIFTAPNCTTPIISLEPCALFCWVSAFHAEIYYNVFTLQIALKEGRGGERKPKDRVKRACFWKFQHFYNLSN